MTTNEPRICAYVYCDAVLDERKRSDALYCTRNHKVAALHHRRVEAYRLLREQTRS